MRLNDEEPSREAFLNPCVTTTSQSTAAVSRAPFGDGCNLKQALSVVMVLALSVITLMTTIESRALADAKNPSNCDTKSLEDTECKVNGFLPKPGAVAGLSANAVLPVGFETDCFVKPCTLDGDFDGDGQNDKAILVSSKKNHKKGIAVIFASGKKVVIGAGQKLGLAGDDFSWLDAWSVVPKNSSIIGDRIALGKTAAGAGLASWQKDHFKWSQSSL